MLYQSSVLRTFSYYLMLKGSLRSPYVVKSQHRVERCSLNFISRASYLNLGTSCFLSMTSRFVKLKLLSHRLVRGSRQVLWSSLISLYLLFWCLRYHLSHSFINLIKSFFHYTYVFSLSSISMVESSNLLQMLTKASLQFQSSTLASMVSVNGIPSIVMVSTFQKNIVLMYYCS